MLLLSACQSSAPTQTPISTAAPTQTPALSPGRIVRPTIPPPRFRIYRSKLDEGTSVVVPLATSDEQLKSLLWFFREKVKSDDFRAIGITQPTSTHWGKKGYSSGMLSVYRREKCASEIFVDGGNPCGNGDHDDAFYQWGLLVDGVFDSNKDAAGVVSADGNIIKIFDYKDDWQPAK
jgi:hypothetical protein